jgi:hypothetical protein
LSGVPLSEIDCGENRQKIMNSKIDPKAEIQRGLLIIGSVAHCGPVSSAGNVLWYLREKGEHPESFGPTKQWNLDRWVESLLVRIKVTLLGE